MKVGNQELNLKFFLFHILILKNLFSRKPPLLILTKKLNIKMNNISLTIKIERAISELRRGGKLVVSDNNSGTSVLLVASELIQQDTIEKLSNLALSRPNIILSKNRCKAIGITRC